MEQPKLLNGPIAKMFGKSDIYEFKIDIVGNIQSFDFLKLNHIEHGDILCQVVNITRDAEKLVGECKVIGFREAGVLKNIRTPFANDVTIEHATDKFIENTIGLNIDKKDFIGILENHPNLKISLDLKKVITKHIAILAKSGAGKSYTVGVILEEVIKKGVPVVILDPHNEYGSLKYPNNGEKDLKRLEMFNLKPQGFLERVKEYSPDIVTNPQCAHISLDIKSLKPQELVESFPQKLSPAQQSLLFNVLSNVNNRIDFDELIFNISNEESNAKWPIITLLEQLKKLKIYSSNPTPLSEIVKQKKVSIISFKGVDPYVTETFAGGLLRDLFEARKREEIPPFLLVLEEAHNFCPERSFGELKTSKVIRTIAGEGRKFGVGLCVISQRPAKIDKNVVSQCSTQILLKITNPNDLKSVISSSEGVTSDSENEIQKLNIGTCLLTGVIDIPLKVNIRPRISKHGGETVDITLSYETEDSPLVQQAKPGEGNRGIGELENRGHEKKVEIKEESIEIKKKKDEVTEIKEEKKITEKTEKKVEEKSEIKLLNEEKGNEIVEYYLPEQSLDVIKESLGSEFKSHLAFAVMIKLRTHSGKDIFVFFDKSTRTLVKSVFPFEGVELTSIYENLNDNERKLIPIILKMQDKFNPAELLLKTDMMYNEIIKACDLLSSKGILIKMDKSYEIGKIKFAKTLENFNFNGNKLYGEVLFDKREKEVISDEKVKAIFSLFGKVDNIKETNILKYVKS